MIHSRELYADKTEHNEHNDCVVRATAVAGCTSYDEAHKLLESHGRKRRRGTPIEVTMAALKDGYNATIRNADGISLAQFLLSAPEGHYVCLTSSHAFAVVDGKVYDWAPHPRCRVRWYFRLA